MTSAPCGTPKAFGLSTITWIARTRIPLLVVPAHGGAPPPSQVCSLRVTEPIPGTRIVVLGGGLSLTDMPPTESPIRLVPCESDEDFPRLRNDCVDEHRTRTVHRKHANILCLGKTRRVAVGGENGTGAVAHRGSAAHQRGR